MNAHVFTNACYLPDISSPRDRELIMSSNNTAQRHTCFGRIFCGTARDVAERECEACAVSVPKYDESRTYVVTGYTPEKRSAYFQRNVAGQYVDAVVERAVAAGWTDIVAGPESF